MFSLFVSSIFGEQKGEWLTSNSLKLQISNHCSPTVSRHLYMNTSLSWFSPLSSSNNPLPTSVTILVMSASHISSLILPNNSRTARPRSLGRSCSARPSIIGSTDEVVMPFVVLEWIVRRVKVRLRRGTNFLTGSNNIRPIISLEVKW